MEISLNNIITLHRGDTGKLEFDLILDRYDSDFDHLYLGFTEPNQPWECALMKKIAEIIPANTQGNYKAVFTFNHEDTENILPGKYYYEVKLVRRSQTDVIGFETVETIRSKTIFYII